MNKNESGLATNGDKGAHTDSPSDGRATQFTTDPRSTEPTFSARS